MDLIISFLHGGGTGMAVRREFSVDGQRHESIPTARVSGLVITEAADEVLVYDTERHHIHHLNHTSAVIWRLLDGRRTVSDVVREARPQLGGEFTGLAVQEALTKLDEASLLDGPLADEVRLSGQSRRRLMKRAALAGAVATIVSITAPMAASAGSPPCTGDMRALGCPCDKNSQCSSGKCTGVAPNETCTP